jgi:hypothetical protein
MWRFSTSPITYQDGWWPTPRWAARVLGVYAIAALAGGLVFVICAGMVAFFSPRETPIHPTTPTETRPPTAPSSDKLIETSPLVAGVNEESLKLIAFVKLLENKDKDPQAIRTFTNQVGLEQKYPLGFPLFYSNGRKTLYYGRPSSSGISFDPSTLQVTRKDEYYCLNILPVRIRDVMPNIRYSCFAGHGVIHPLRLGDINLVIQPLATSTEGAAWVLGMKPAQ